jgi:hypothetical protein
MNINDLGKIKTVEAPPFLYTRILEKVETLNTTAMPQKIAWTLGLSFLVIVSLNIGLIIKNLTDTQSLETYAQTIHLTSNNTLYK